VIDLDVTDDPLHGHQEVWRDNLDEVAATIRMVIWCRG
jgi:hypothetical protein